MQKKAGITLESKTTHKRCKTFEELLPDIHKFGKDMTPDFKLQGDSLNFYKQLYYYFSPDENIAKNFNGSLKKGLLVSGNIGCGKTTAMKIFRKLTYQFRIYETRYIIREFNIDGMEVLNKYGKESYLQKYPEAPKTPINLCFDDFGLEDTNSQLYGNSANVIGEIMLDRYEGFVNYGIRTHATTNLSPANIEEIYGDRLRDRLREMMNFIVLKGNTLRK